MRTVGVLFLLIGIGIGIVWPRVQLEYFGRELAQLEFQHPEFNTAKSHSIELTQTDNPVRVLFRASYLLDGKLPPVKMPAKILITDRDGTFLNGILSFPTNGISEGPEQPSARASQSLDFDVLNDGEHVFALNLAPNENDGGILRPDVEKITATVYANVPVMNDNHKAFAAIFGVAGVYLLLRSRRRKNPKSPEPQKWGRG
ncbi:MAG: hypothetical protein AAF478_03145 [Pseudomonadota bacterium]